MSDTVMNAAKEKYTEEFTDTDVGTYSLRELFALAFHLGVEWQLGQTAESMGKVFDKPATRLPEKEDIEKTMNKGGRP